MDGRGLQRSHSGLDAHVPNPHNHGRKLRKASKKSHNNVPERDGRAPPCPGQHAPGHASDQSFPLFNNRSLSMISTIHHLNPHRKIAMSPELLREAEEQASSLKKANKHLHEQLEKTTREKTRIHRFLSDLLYTLNARGYESVRDHEGTLVDLNKCKGDAYLDLKGRDLKQRVNVRRPGGQEFLLKAVIGNQERVIQSLVFKLDSIGRDMVLGNRLTVDDTGSCPTTESTKISSLEAEVLQLVNLIEGACYKSPEIYPALRDHYYLNEGKGPDCDLSPRNPVIQNLLKKCEQISRDAQSRQLVEMLSSSSNSRSKSAQILPPPKATKSRSNTKSKATTAKGPRVVSSELLGPAGENPRPLSEYDCIRDSADCSRPCPQTRFSKSNHGTGGPPEGQLKQLNGPSKSDNSFTIREVPPQFQRSSSLTVATNSSDHQSPDTSVTVCPYCRRRFGIEESISEIKNHIEMHIFAGDTALA